MRPEIFYCKAPCFTFCSGLFSKMDVHNTCESRYFALERPSFLLHASAQEPLALWLAHAASQVMCRWNHNPAVQLPLGKFEHLHRWKPLP